MMVRKRKIMALLSTYYVLGTVLSAFHMLSIKARIRGRFWNSRVVGSE